MDLEITPCYDFEICVVFVAKQGFYPCYDSASDSESERKCFHLSAYLLVMQLK